eukprot:365668-Chlamydomonas_euryale.AAC.15
MTTRPPLHPPPPPCSTLPPDPTPSPSPPVRHLLAGVHAQRAQARTLWVSMASRDAAASPGMALAASKQPAS